MILFSVSWDVWFLKNLACSRDWPSRAGMGHPCGEDSSGDTVSNLRLSRLLQCASSGILKVHLPVILDSCEFRNTPALLMAEGTMQHRTSKEQHVRRPWRWKLAPPTTLTSRSSAWFRKALALALITGLTDSSTFCVVLQSKLQMRQHWSLRAETPVALLRIAFAAGQRCRSLFAVSQRSPSARG